MHAFEIITCFGPVIVMSHTRRGLLTILYRDFLSSDSLANGDEPDETVIPPISEAKKLSLTEISTAQR